MSPKIIFWCYAICVWIANINDIIRGSWFYHDVYGIILWNFLGILAVLSLIFYDKLYKKNESEEIEN